jgi:hypothetical protein
MDRRKCLEERFQGASRPVFSRRERRGKIATATLAVAFTDIDFHHRQPSRLPSHALAFPTGNPRGCLHRHRLPPPATLAVAFTDTASIPWLFQGASRRVFPRRERREKNTQRAPRDWIFVETPNRTGNPRGCLHRLRFSFNAEKKNTQRAPRDLSECVFPSVTLTLNALCALLRSMS